MEPCRQVFREHCAMALFAHSVAMCKTFVGYAISLPTQFSIFLPKPLSTLEASLTLSVSLKVLSRPFARSPVGTITASWIILNLRGLPDARRDRMGLAAGCRMERESWAGLEIRSRL